MSAPGAASARTTRRTDAPQPLAPSLPIIITIDGPAGTGKSCVARLLAARLGLDFLDTGAMYRAAAAIVLDRNVPREDHARILREVVAADIHFDFEKDPPSIIAAGNSLDKRIREKDVTDVVSPISAIPALREHLVAKQRAIAGLHPRLVTEGRDQGSVVFPGAGLKFYLDASPEVRALRRARQLGFTDAHPEYGAILRDIVERDRSDMSRAVGPLVCPADAEVVDTSDLDLEQVVAELERRARNRYDDFFDDR